MTPKFSKALLCAGLAAALVGCGGGSSTTAMNGGGSMTEPTEPTEPTETDALDRTYETVKSLVDGLSADSSVADFTEAKSARTALLNRLLAVTDVSQEKQADLNTKLDTLKTAIEEQEKARATKIAAEAENTKNKRIAGLLPSAWYKAVKDHDPVNPGTFPDNDVLIGTKTNVTGLPEGWTGMNYEYEEGASNEQGKTFKKTVTRMTPGITMRWDEVVLEAAKTNRNSAINDFLGGPGLTIEAIKTTVTEGIITNTRPIAGSGTVSARISSHTAADNIDNTPAPAPPTSFANGANFIRATDFRRKDFTAMSANDLIAAGVAANTIDPGLNPNPNVWYDLDTPLNLGTVTGGNEKTRAATLGIYVKWKDIPGRLTLEQDGGDTAFDLRFNGDKESDNYGKLEYLPRGVFGADNFVKITFQPSKINDLNEVNTNIHAMDLMVRPESTKTATTELAYWASTMKDNNKVTLETWAEGMGFDLVTTMPEELTGSATYNGLAAGYYAVGTESNGEFTADTMLTANFGTNMVNGTIKGFEAVTGGADLSPWSLTLNSASFIDNKNADDMTDDVFKTFTGRTVSNGGMLGHWKGEFLGMANPGLEDDLESAADMTNDYPEAVVGNFTGHFDNNGHVAGAFGVELHEDYKNK